MNTQQFLQERIAATQAQIIAYEAAVEALVTGGVQNYMIDTGQTRQSVTKLDLKALQEEIDRLYNRCATLEARLNGSGTVNVRPVW